MKRINSLLLTLFLGASSLMAQQQTFGYPITQVPFTSVKIAPASFWGERINAAREVTVPLAFSKCESEGRYANFVKAAAPSSEYKVGEFMLYSFDDTDVYKTIEGASYLLQTFPDKQLEAYIDSVLDIVARAQEPDGYLYTARTINPKSPHGWAGETRWSKVEKLSHEFYNLGHMVDAACAHYQATGSRKFLDIAIRYADCVVREVGPDAGQACVVPGHQIAEMALSRLYVLTGEQKYLDQAKFFLDMRGKTSIKQDYSQSHAPVVDQKEAVGHAVRAGYMYSGMADVAALTGDSSYIRAIDRIYDNIVGKKYYLTGGVGARHGGEAFGRNYELPNLTAYNETCAAISMVYFFHRMFLLHGHASYIDCLERTLYNGVISGMSVDGGRFFYPNPLSCDGKYGFNYGGTQTRQPWFGCACCPSNVCRFIPSLPGYLYAVKDDNLYVNLYAPSESAISVKGKEVVLCQETNYPWDGDISLRISSCKAKDFTLKLRIPGWVQGKVVPTDLYSYVDGCELGYTVSINGTPVETNISEDGYLAISRRWKKGDEIRLHLDMQPRLVAANQRVQADRGKVAIERGPIVYCAEWADNEGLNPLQILMGKNPKFDIDMNYVVQNTEADGGVPFNTVSLVTKDAQLLQAGEEGFITTTRQSLRLIPYYAWNHRGAGYMSVWFAQTLSGFGAE